MSLKVKIAGYGAALLLALGFVTVTAIPASAAPGCYSSQVCIWQNINYGGTAWTYSGLSIGPCYWVGAAVINQGSAIFNTYNWTAVRFYDNGNCSGDNRTLNRAGSPYDHISDLTSFPSFNDRIESFQLLG